MFCPAGRGWDGRAPGSLLGLWMGHALPRDPAMSCGGAPRRPPSFWAEFRASVLAPTAVRGLNYIECYILGILVQPDEGRAIRRSPVFLLQYAINMQFTVNIKNNIAYYSYRYTLMSH